MEWILHSDIVKLFWVEKSRPRILPKSHKSISKYMSLLALQERILSATKTLIEW